MSKDVQLWTKDKLETAVKGCSCCDEDHANVVFTRMPNPLRIGDCVYAFRGTCPNTGAMIYLRFDTML